MLLVDVLYSIGSLPDGSVLVELQHRRSVNIFGKWCCNMCLLFSSTCLSLSTYRINEKLATCKIIHPSFSQQSQHSQPRAPQRHDSLCPLGLCFLLPKWEFAGNCPPGLFRFVLHSFQNKWSVSGLLYLPWLPCSPHKILKNVCKDWFCLSLKRAAITALGLPHCIVQMERGGHGACCYRSHTVMQRNPTQWALIASVWHF